MKLPRRALFYFFFCLLATGIFASLIYRSTLQAALCARYRSFAQSMISGNEPLSETDALFSLSPDGTLRTAIPSHSVLFPEPALQNTLQNKIDTVSVRRIACAAFYADESTVICAQSSTVPRAVFDSANQSALLFTAFVAVLGTCGGAYALFFAMGKKTAEILNTLPDSTQSGADELFWLARAVEKSREEEKNRSLMRKEAERELLHELRAPLTALSCVSETLCQYPEKSSEYLPLALSETARMARLLERFSTDRQTIHRVPLSLRTLTEDCVKLFSPAARKSGVQIFFSADDLNDAFVVLGDGDLLREVICNLLTNALQAAKQKAVIRLLLSRKQTDSKHIIKLAVLTTGAQIPQVLIPRLFERHVSGNGGSGIGLYLCREIVYAHNGKLNAENLKHASQFTIELPICG